MHDRGLVLFGEGQDWGVLWRGYMLTADDDDFIVRRLLILLDVLMAFAYILELFAYGGVFISKFAICS